MMEVITGDKWIGDRIRELACGGEVTQAHRLQAVKDKKRGDERVAAYRQMLTQPRG